MRSERDDSLCGKILLDMYSVSKDTDGDDAVISMSAVEDILWKHIMEKSGDAMIKAREQ